MVIGSLFTAKTVGHRRMCGVTNDVLDDEASRDQCMSLRDWGGPRRRRRTQTTDTMMTTTTVTTTALQARMTEGRYNVSIIDFKSSLIPYNGVRDKYTMPRVPASTHYILK